MAITLTYPDGCALVCGGTGRVGTGVVRRIAQAGVPTIFTYRGSEAAAKTLEAELRAEGLKVWARQMEMTDDASIDATVAFAQEQAGRLHTVLVPAGAPVPFSRIADFTADEVGEFFKGDGLAFFRVVQRVVPIFRQHGGGSFVLCSTYALKRVLDFDGISPFSKGAVEALIRQIAAEEAPHNIRCNGVGISVVIPATIEEFLAVMPPDPGAGLDVTHPDQMMCNLLNRVVGWMRTRRPAAPEEAGDLFAYLASNQASYISGQTVVIDGGAAL
jgi:NAD(P)-dependent dehydrogenase (short-subunit alcohol dehydrogenase family)